MLKEPLELTKGIEKGIASSPHFGFEDIRNLDILSTPGSVFLNFKLEALTKPPTVTNLAYTTTTATDLMTVASTSGWYNGMAITLDTVVTSTGISTGRVYWVGNLSGNTFKLYKNPSLPTAQLVDITGSNGSGTLSSYTLSAPLDKAYLDTFTSTIFRPYEFILDTAGRVWWVKNVENAVPGLTTNLVYLGNDTLVAASGRAIAVFNQDLVVFRYNAVDKLDLGDIENTGVDFDAAGGWEYAISAINTCEEVRRSVVAGQDAILYYAADNDVGSLTTAYVNTTSALDLTNDEIITALGELGDSLLIGTKGYKVYPWDRVSESTGLPIILPDFNTARIVTANQYAFIFAGNRGRIYVTNGTTVEEYAKFPDHLTGAQEPYFTWGDALTWRNQLYFSFTATTNAGVALTTTGGVWAYNIPTKALRYTNQPSYGSYAGSVTVLMPHILASAPPGNAIYVGWSNSSTYGLDISSTSYATSYSAYFITPVYLITLPLTPLTMDQIDYILDKLLASGEGVRVSYRVNRSDSFTLVDTFDFTTYGAIQWINKTFPTTDLITVQFKVEVTGNTTTPILKALLLR